MPHVHQTPPHDPVCHGNRVCSAAATDPSTAPLRGIVIAATEYNSDDTTDTITAYDPTTGEVTATRIFTVPSEYTTYPPGACEREQCYSPDFERVLARDTSGGNGRIAVTSSDGSFTLLNDLIPVPSGSRSYSNAYAKFGPDGSIYVAHEDKSDDGDFVGTLYRFAYETSTPEAVPTTFTVSNTQDFQILPIPLPSRSATTRGRPTKMASDATGHSPSPRRGRA